MKTFITTVAFSIILNFAYSQSDVEYNDENGSFEMIVRFDSTRSVSEIYRGGRDVIIRYSKDAKDVIQLDDAEQSKLFARGYTTVNWQLLLSNYTINVWFDLDFQVKEGRYRVFCNNVNYEYFVQGAKNEISMLEFEKMRSGKSSQRTVEDSKNSIVQFMHAFESDIKTDLAKKSDW